MAHVKLLVESLFERVSEVYAIRTYAIRTRIYIIHTYKYLRALGKNSAFQVNQALQNPDS